MFIYSIHSLYQRFLWASMFIQTSSLSPSLPSPHANTGALDLLNQQGDTAIFKNRHATWGLSTGGKIINDMAYAIS